MHSSNEVPCKTGFLLPEQGYKNSVHLARPGTAADIDTIGLILSSFLPRKDSSWDEPIGNKLKIFFQDIGTKELSGLESYCDTELGTGGC